MLRLPVDSDLSDTSLKEAIKILTEKTGQPPHGLIVGPENQIPAEELLHGGNDAMVLHVIQGMPRDSWMLFNGSDILISELP